MSGFALVKKYVEIINSADWSKLEEIVAPDLHFKSQLAEFFTLDDLIAYNSSLASPYHCETLILEGITADLIRHKYTLSIIDDGIFDLPVDQLFTIREDKIVKTVLFYDKSMIPQSFSNLLKSRSS